MTTTAGATLMAGALIGESFTPFNAANARLGVGNSGAAAEPEQTDLQGGSKVRLPMQAGYPQRVGNVLTFRALAGTGQAAFQWDEVGVFNAASGGTMLWRLPRSFGTKPSGQIWALSVQLEVTDA